MNNDYERELGWDDEIQQESEFTLLDEGDYDFEVTKLERGRSNGSDKIPPSNMAILTLKVTDGRNSTTITERLVLHTILEWKLSQFFIAIGQKKHGKPLKMNWNRVVGAKGRCKVKVESYTNKYGEEKQSNRIDKYYDYIAPQPSSKGFTAGEF